MSKQNKIAFRFIREKGIASSLSGSFLQQSCICIKQRAVWPDHKGPYAQIRHPEPLDLVRPLSQSSIHRANSWREAASPGNVAEIHRVEYIPAA